MKKEFENPLVECRVVSRPNCPLRFAVETPQGKLAAMFDDSEDAAAYADYLTARIRSDAEKEREAAAGSVRNMCVMFGVML